MKKIPFAVIELTSHRVRGLRGTSELPGRPATVLYCNVPSILVLYRTRGEGTGGVTRVQVLIHEVWNSATRGEAGRIRVLILLY